MREHFLTGEAAHQVGEIGRIVVCLGTNESYRNDITKANIVRFKPSSNWDKETCWMKIANEGCRRPVRGC